MKITRLESENVKRLRAVTIEPDGSLVIVAGKNEQGKTSVLDSIAYALGGKRLIPSEPLRKGAKRGSVKVSLDNGLTVTRTFTRGGSGTLVVTQDGTEQRSPQRILDTLVGQLAFDPLAFKLMDPASRLDLVRGMVPQEVRDAIEEIDREREQMAEERRDLGRDVRRLRGALESMPAVERVDPVDVADLSGRLTDIERKRRALMDDAALARHERTDADREWSAAQLLRTQLMRELREAEKRVAEAHAASKQWADEVKQRESKLDAVPEPVEIREQLKTAQATNDAAAAWKRREEVADELRKVESEHSARERALNDMISTRESALAEAEIPVANLAFTDDGVTYKGVPFEQASGAEQLQASVEIGLALNPELRVMLVRDGSLLDEDHLAMLAQMADKSDAQVWLEVVSDRSDASVVIEDGMVKEREGEVSE